MSDHEYLKAQDMEGAEVLQEFNDSMLRLDQPLLLACLRREMESGQQASALKSVAKAYGHLLRVAVLDLAVDKRFRGYFNIMGTPTYIVLENGEELDRMLGKADEATLHSFVRQVLDIDS